VPVRAAQAAGTLSRGGGDLGPGGPGGVFRTPGLRFAGLAGGRTRQIRGLIVVLPAGKRRQNVPGRPPAAGGR
jgi:hypothetical protein